MNPEPHTGSRMSVRRWQINFASRRTEIRSRWCVCLSWHESGIYYRPERKNSTGICRESAVCGGHAFGVGTERSHKIQLQ